MTILDSLNPFKSVADVVAIYDENMEQVFSGARIIKAILKPTSQLMVHPVETGNTIVDDKIILPVEIDLSVIFDSDTVSEEYQNVKQAFRDSKLFSLQTRVDTFTNLVIADIPHQEDADMYATVSMNLKLKEVQFVQAQFDTLPPKKVEDKKDSTTAKRGQITAKDAADGSPVQEKSQSILFELFN